MSIYKEHIQNFAWEINNGLTAYIEIHNKIFREAGTFKSLVKNIFGKPVSMSELLNDAKSLILMWNNIVEKITIFSNESYSLMDENEKLYFDILEKYAKALSETVAVLTERQKLLNKRSKVGQVNKVNWQTFKEIDYKYESSIREYKLYGKELNELNHLIFE
ncbi:MAG: hypothetical protein GWP19_03105 [Planctomycetia bacterium]|nr:hypothetical protein [Planctomycetia bacterium]